MSTAVFPSKGAFKVSWLGNAKREICDRDIGHKSRRTASSRLLSMVLMSLTGQVCALREGFKFCTVHLSEKMRFLV